MKKDNGNDTGKVIFEYSGPPELDPEKISGHENLSDVPVTRLLISKEELERMFPTREHK